MNEYIIHFPIRAITKDNEKYFNKYTGRPFTSQKYKLFESECKEIARKQFKRKPLEGSLAVTIEFRFINHKHPDLFNLPKSICDAMSGVLWKDDRQINIGHLSIVYGKDEIRLIVQEL